MTKIIKGIQLALTRDAVTTVHGKDKTIVYLYMDGIKSITVDFTDGTNTIIKDAKNLIQLKDETKK